ncbi:hypothetical protein [Salinisphaera sp. Q1T1-3]|uniref:hypothetical protein n=1 Tax=Salinisphaera sp. Q1T1-3 TaxID=2321229 RepID=UPI000E7722E8|nr:hypothetical protein [Salinisphaera sp. Q1T1-3]RJS93074.1 hypothetical protein D3260_09245 [Salinisphaera sp. Q1T1-3]
MIILLWIHILSGSVAFAGLTVALGAGKGRRGHRLAGRTYGAAMAISLMAAVGLSIVLPSLFLGTIAIFTAYMVATGIRLAACREQRIGTSEYLLAAVAALNGALMIGYGIWLGWHGAPLGVVMGVFGMLAGGIAAGDLVRSQWPIGAERIVLHLGRMGGSAIATSTAVLVVNMPAHFEPAWLPWLAPTVIGTPFIAWESARRLRAQVRSPVRFTGAKSIVGS